MLLFAPLGAVLHRTRRSGGIGEALMSAGVAGFSMSFGIESLQVFHANRQPSGYDVIWNVLGATAGVGMSASAGLIASRWPMRFIGSAAAAAAAVRRVTLGGGEQSYE